MPVLVHSGHEDMFNIFGGFPKRSSLVTDALFGFSPLPESKRHSFTSFLFGAGIQFHAPLDFAGSSSTYTSDIDQTEDDSSFQAKQALTPGSGYWCSEGKHKPDSIVVWTAGVKKRRAATGIKISWAYAPGEVRVRSTADGLHWDEVVGWHQPATTAVSFEEDMFFDRPRHVMQLKVEMRKPKPWGYFGINQATLVL